MLVTLAATNGTLTLGSTAGLTFSTGTGTANTVIAMTIAVLKGAVVAAIFMELRERNPLTLTFAGAGFFWLGIMLWLAFSDYTTRANFPPAIGWGS